MSMIAVPDASLPTLRVATMMLCFGVTCPLANLRMLRTGRAEGKGSMFTLIILCGYGAGLGGQVGAGCPGRGAAGGVLAVPAEQRFRRRQPGAAMASGKPHVGPGGGRTRGPRASDVGGGHIPNMNPLRSARDWIRDIHHAR